MAGAFYIPKRYILVVLIFMGYFVSYALRVNLSVAMVAMVNSTFSHVDTSIERECWSGMTNISVHKKVKDGEFNWDQKHQGIILSSFFYGYLITQLPGGWLATKFGGKHVFCLGVFLASVFSLLTPLAARANFYLFIVVRIFEGLGEGVCFPATHTMMAKWAPLNEKTRMVMFAYSGIVGGTITSLQVCSVLADSNFLGGWPSAFYVFGTLGIIWCVAWTKYAQESPEHHLLISIEEKKYITDSQKKCPSNTKNAAVPWLKIFTSIHAWAIIIAHFCNIWVWYFVLTGLPSYFRQVLNFSLEENGLLSTLPFIVALFIIADYLINHWLTVTQTRRLLAMLAFYSAALSLVLASFARCDQISLSVAYMVVGTGLLRLNNCSFMVNHLDIAPRFGGILYGISNTAGGIAGSISPTVTGYFTNDSPTRANYRKVFLLAAGVSVLGGTFFSLFVSGEQQPWNNLNASSKTIPCHSNIGAEVDTTDGTVQDNSINAEYQRNSYL